MRLKITDSPLLLFCCLIVFAALVKTGQACNPEFYFLFRSEAQVRLDSLNTKQTSENALERFVLMHNLAFGKNEQQRKKAEKLLEKQFPRHNRSSLISAYAGSLKMIKVSQRTTGSKVIRTLSPFRKSPYSEAREGYHQISIAVIQDSTSTVLRFIRATAATESAEYLNELFDSARIDLEWLQANLESSDSVYMFLIHLNWSKYYFKLAKEEERIANRSNAIHHINIALAFACTPAYCQWSNKLRSKITKSEISGQWKK